MAMPKVVTNCSRPKTSATLALPAISLSMKPRAYTDITT
jgi:hypothetical protein